MNIPTAATDILARMANRGYPGITIQRLRKTGREPVYVRVEWPEDERKRLHKWHSRWQHWSISADGKSILACCRDIERQWEADQ